MVEKGEKVEKGPRKGAGYMLRKVEKTTHHSKGMGFYSDPKLLCLSGVISTSLVQIVRSGRDLLMCDLLAIFAGWETRAT